MHHLYSIRILALKDSALILLQMHEGKEHVVAYVSKTLSESQKCYCTTYRELLALVLFIHSFIHSFIQFLFSIIIKQFNTKIINIKKIKKRKKQKNIFDIACGDAVLLLEQIIVL